MKKCLFLLLLNFSMVLAQVNGWLENFDDMTLDGWEVPGDASRTYELQAIDSSLLIQYHRVPQSWEWDNFNWMPPQTINADNKPYITIRVKSNLITELTVKPIYDSGQNDWLQVMLPNDNQWHTYRFELIVSKPRVINRIYFYLDGGTTVTKEGQVYFDDLRLADSVRAADLLDASALEQAINAAENLLQNSTEGNEEGQFPPGSKLGLQNAINEAQAVLNKSDVTQDELDQATWDLYDACVNFEIQVNAPQVPLIDQKATLQTRNLYLNLDYLKDKALLFGMHDATGYGVGWSGDDDRSDIKDVCGDYPALYSEEMYKVTLNKEEQRVRYRLTSAYERGGVLSMCWHQYDPQGRGFYASDVQNENVVATILPGGIYHQEYKAKLKKVALFFKSLRGPKGESIPIIFRPYHEHNGSWFWWGKGQCTTQQYIQLWQFTVRYLRDSLNVHNLMYALSPSLNQSSWGTNYKEIFPGQDFVDIYGVDHYFGDNISSLDKENFRKGLQRIAEIALQDEKLPALTEVGQEGLKTTDFFTNVLLWAIKNDSLNTNFSYAAVWRNQDIYHHFAPYPGHPSVPDFIKFYNDPFTFFESDLSDLYGPVTADTLAPYFVNYPLSPFIATDTLFYLEIETNEKAQLKYDYADLPFDSMAFEFSEGQNSYNHRTAIQAEQHDNFQIFIRARDLFGNTMDTSLVIHITVDTLQRPVYWYESKYDFSDWPSDSAPFVFEGQSGSTQLSLVRTVYFRSDFEIEDINQINKLAAILNVDNGFILYLNGQEVHRENLPSGQIDYDSWAETNADGVKQIIIEKDVLNNLKNGRNVLAVEVHQAKDDSLDLMFDLKLITDTYQTLIDYGQEWFYFARGHAPEVQLLGNVAISIPKEIPEQFLLFQNFPNPFNQQTTIVYNLPYAGKVRLTIFNILGQKIKEIFSNRQSAGLKRVNLSLNNWPSGVYIYRLQFENEERFGKMVLLK